MYMFLSGARDITLLNGFSIFMSIEDAMYLWTIECIIS